ncbi:MAG: transposase [Clostridia bacterium]|nr:transposase [bacterium]MBR4110268.1 transposase [Clostridia bacterium]
MIIVAGRIFSSLGINHVVIKGINGQPVFLDNEDRIYFLNLLNSKLSTKFVLISYCLMSNHIHLLLKENTFYDTSNLMRNFIAYYAKWFNAKHNRTSSLFKQTFYSEGIESEKQLINTINYIHKNPVKAGIVNDAQYYPWCSYNKYLSNDNKIVDTHFIEQYSISKDSILLSSQLYPTTEFDNSELYLKSYDCIFDCIEEYLKGRNIFELMKMNSEEQHKLIKYLVLEKNFSQRKISKIFNFSTSKISAIMKSYSDANIF